MPDEVRRVDILFKGSCGNWALELLPDGEIADAPAAEALDLYVEHVGITCPCAHAPVPGPYRAECAEKFLATTMIEQRLRLDVPESDIVEVMTGSMEMDPTMVAVCAARAKANIAREE